MLNRTILIFAAIAAVAGAIVLANALVRVRVDETLVVFTSEEPVVVASDGSFFGWSLRRPFSDYALVTQRVQQSKYEPLTVTTKDGRLCEIRKLAILYDFADPIEAAIAERPHRKRKRISASRTFEGQYRLGLVGEFENLTSYQIQSTLRARRLPESPALSRAAAGYGAEVLTVTDIPEVVCDEPAALQSP